ncbi:allergin-1 [Orycteropus afer afer]|uniref:Allergin-1 n=1 Tax=Orycteropus afer afer TaxID=1230840 RepID=A0AC54ZFD6_ORYAF|nr:allergin-1 [Orycteropus afer afer]
MWERVFLIFLFSRSIQTAVLDVEKKAKTDECPSPILSPETSVVTKGQKVSLICSIKEKSPILKFYSLFLGKNHLKTDTEKGETKIFNLSISEASDLGPYKCKVQVINCSKYSHEFTFTLVDPVAVPVLNVSVIQTEAGQYTLTLHCISPNGSLPIDYTFFEKNIAISPVISKDVREPAEFNFTKKRAGEGDEYRCEAKNRLPNNTRHSQPVSMPSTGGDGCPLCLQLLLPGLLLMLVVLALILACWIQPKYKARKAIREKVPKDYGDSSTEAAAYANICKHQADKESVPGLEPMQYDFTAQDGTGHSQELNYATPIFQKVASGEHGELQLLK